MTLRLTTSALALAVALGWAGAVQAEELKAEVIHWWTSAGESAAVKVFADAFNKAGGTWVDTAIAGGSNARTAAINRIVGGQPPTAMQFNTGKQFDDIIANGLLNDVDAEAKAGGWDKVVPAAFVKAVTRNGKYYAVPINIHGQAWLWYNTAVFEKAGLQPPKTWDDVLADADKLRAAGVVPLAFSGQKTWERGLFNVVLEQKGGRDLYYAVYRDKDPKAVKGDGFKAVAETFAKLRGLVDPGSPGRNWNDATGMVIQGKAAMQIMGDWAKGEFINAHLTPGKEYGCTVLGQGSGDPDYIMGGDVFVMAKTSDPAQVKAQQLLVKVLMDPTTQLAFNAKKGSIPIRQDIDMSSLDICAQRAAQLLKDPQRQIPAVEMLVTSDVTGATEDVISNYWNTPSMTAAAFADKFAGALASTD